LKAKMIATAQDLMCDPLPMEAFVRAAAAESQLGLITPKTTASVEFEKGEKEFALWPELHRAVWAEKGLPFHMPPGPSTCDPPAYRFGTARERSIIDYIELTQDQPQGAACEYYDIGQSLHRVPRGLDAVPTLHCHSKIVARPGWEYLTPELILALQHIFLSKYPHSIATKLSEMAARKAAGAAFCGSTMMTALVLVFVHFQLPSVHLPVPSACGVPVGPGGRAHSMRSQASPSVASDALDFQDFCSRLHLP
jgi:hypothetical protein